MVDLEDIKSTEPPPSEAIIQPGQDLGGQVTKQICRLCLQQDDDDADLGKMVDLFEEPGVDEKQPKAKSVKEILYELFNIKVCK